MTTIVSLVSIGLSWAYVFDYLIAIEHEGLSDWTYR